MKLQVMEYLKTLLMRMKRALLPHVPPEKEFVEWYRTIQQPAQFFSVSARNTADSFFSELYRRLGSDDGGGPGTHALLNGRLPQSPHFAPELSSYKRYIGLFQDQGPQDLIIDSAYIAQLHISNDGHKLIIRDSKIQTLTVYNNGGPHEIEMRNTYVGKIILNVNSVKRLAVYGGGIMELDVPSTGSQNPFSGSVSFTNTWFPTDRQMHQEAQPYRNIRHHLRSLENMRMADLFHALELRTERKHETSRTNKLFSYLYELFSDFGASVVRPLLWLLLIGLFMAYVLIVTEGAIPTALLQQNGVGWQSALIGNEFFSNEHRGLYLSFYTITHPLGLFGGQPLLVANTAWLSILLVLEGILSATLIALVIFALRRRFKLHQR